MAGITEITESDLLEAIAEAAKGNAPKQAKTAGDLVAITGMRRERVREALGRFAMQNRLQVHRVLRPGIDGRQISRPAYTILPPKKGSKR